jgi:AraC family transcriptional regulator
MHPNEPKSLYFALHDFKDDDNYSYMICHNMPKEGTPESYETLSVPALTWAIFSSPEDIGADPAIQCKRAWDISSEWFLTSDYKYVGGAKLEKGYNLGNMNFLYEVWIPVVKK